MHSTYKYSKIHKLSGVYIFHENHIPSYSIRILLFSEEIKIKTLPIKQ